MRYKIEFQLDHKITTQDLRDIKLQLLQDEVELTIVSDYPLFVPETQIFLDKQLFNITKKDVRISKDFHTIIVNIIDNKTLMDIKRAEAESEHQKFKEMMSYHINLDTRY